MLLVLAVAGVALAATCRTTLRRSAAATAAVADLQQRWGSVSVQYTVLSDAGNVLERAEVAEGPGGPPVATLHAAIDLGRVRFDVDVCDDQARANVNGLLAWRGRTAAEGLVRDLARAAGGHRGPHLPAVSSAKPLHALSTTPDADAEPDEPTTDRVPPVLGSLSDVYPGATWDELRPPGLAAVLTVHGDGKVNPRRASVAVLSAACGPLLSPPQVAALSRAARLAGNTFDIPGTLAAAGAKTDAVLRVQSRLVDGSFTQSVWIEARSNGRVWRTWAARDDTDADHPRTFAAAW